MGWAEGVGDAGRPGIHPFPRREDMTRIPCVLLGAALALFGLAQSSDADAARPAPDEPAPPMKAPAPGAKKADARIVDEIVRLTNRERTQRGLKPLKVNVHLTAAAAVEATNIARAEKLDHNIDGTNAGQRIDKTGYKWSSYGENIAYGYPDAAAVVEGWMNSEGHRKNILNPDFVEIGVAVEKSARGTPYYCQVFAKPR
jgi:uncharacterized protein YkwD